MPRQFYDRHLPVRPNLEQLRNQAKDLPYDLRHGEPRALDLWRKHHPESPLPTEGRFSDAQFVLANVWDRNWARPRHCLPDD